MTELEALRRVAEAARALATRNLGRVVLGWQELDAALRALDALPAPAAEPVGEVVEVRGKIYEDLADRGYIVRDADEPISPIYRRHVANFTVRVPLPRVPEVVGEVG